MIAIWADAQIFGGIQVLIVRFSQYLSKNSIPFILISTKGTRISDELYWAKQVDPCDLKDFDAHIDYVFFPHVCNLRQDIYWEKFSDSRILCWLVHPTEVFSSFFPVVNRLLALFGYPVASWAKKVLASHNVKLCLLLQKLVSGHALIVMDGATRRGLKFFFPEVVGECELVPIPSPTEDVVWLQKKNSPRISIGYLGRIDEFKASALLPFIEYDLKALSDKHPIEMHFVSEGNCLSQVINLCHIQNIIVHNYGFVPNAEARRILRERTDFAVCMGTAALDIAAAGHPCIVIDPSLKRPKSGQRKFRFVHELEDFTVGEFRDFERYNPGRHSLEQVVRMVKSDEGLGSRGLEYVAEHHSPDRVFASLLGAIKTSSVYGKDVEILSSDVRKSFLSIDRAVRRLLPRFFLDLFRKRNSRE